MNIHEYQAKAVLKSFGAPVSRGVPVMRAAEARATGPIVACESINPAHA